MSRTMEVVYIADQGSGSFEEDRLAVDIVCVGDSLTGWNNYGHVQYWPYPTYPHFLQGLCKPLDLRVADGGMAGEISGNGLGHVRHYLDLFSNSRYVAIGFGTNDLAMWPDVASTSKRILESLDSMILAVRGRGQHPILLNIPYVNESKFSWAVAADTHHRRDYHNSKLADYCREKAVPLADICMHLRNRHFGDELHPNEAGARIIAEQVFEALTSVHLA